MSAAQVTEAHRVLARHLSTEAESVPHLCDLMAQAIADSEARTIAAAVAPLEARITSDEELFHDIRMKLTAACGDPYKLHDEALDAIITERDRLRAEVKESKERERVAIASWDEERQRALREGGQVVELRTELALLREWRREVIQNANAHHAERREAIARAERAEAEVDQLTDGLRDSEAALALNALRAARAEAELDGIRALADRRNERDHSQDTTHQLVAALDQALDIAQAELATERARLDWLLNNIKVSHTAGK